jgi:hypothetical protein
MAKKHETALLALILSGAEKGNQYLFPVLKELIKHRDFIFSVAPKGTKHRSAYSIRILGLKK